MRILEKRLPDLPIQEREALRRCFIAMGNALPIKQIILFGSRARGNSNADSDVDLCVVSDNVLSQYRAVRDLRRSIGRIRGKPSLSIIPISPQRLEEKRRSRDPFFETVLQEGVTVVEED
jgi:predicted nucleotidyltransferase